MEPNFSLFGKIKWNEINMVNNFRNVYFIASWGLKSKQILYGIFIISIQGPFPCKAISKIDWKTAKL